MIASLVLAALVFSAEGGHGSDAGNLPWCSNRVINEVVRRAGCTVGDTSCWLRSGGFCTDWVEKRAAARSPKAARLEPIRPEEVKEGDVAAFSTRAHYAWVEEVIRDATGRALAVNVSELNFGTCWVDKDAMVTDKYKVLTRRSAVPLRDVDGGFLRLRPGGR